MSLRERGLVFLAGAALVVTLFDSLLIEPRFAAAKRMSVEIARQDAERAALEKQLQAAGQASAQDPDREKRSRLERLQRELAALEAGVTAEQRKLTTPQQMRAVVENLIARTPGVTLVDLRTSPKAASTAERAAQVANEAAAALKGGLSAEALATAGLLHRHPLEVTVRGQYLDLLKYLSELERLPYRIYWSDLALDAALHPQLVLRLQVYTLSLDRTWMSV